VFFRAVENSLDTVQDSTQNESSNTVRPQWQQDFSSSEMDEQAAR